MFYLMYRTSQDRNASCPMCQTPLSVKDFEEEFNIEDFLNDQWIDVKNELLKGNEALPEASSGNVENSVDR